MMARNLILLLACSSIVSGSLTACSSDQNADRNQAPAELSNPHDFETDSVSESQVSTRSPFKTDVLAAVTSTTKAGDILYSGDNLRARSAPTLTPDTVLDVLPVNTRVQILDLRRDSSDGFVLVKVVEGNSGLYNQTIYVSGQHLHASPQSVDTGVTDNLANTGRYFIVQNIATERLRVYERCQTGASCVNKLVMEAEMVAGQNEEDTLTQLGHYRITKWYKFYQDGLDYGVNEAKYPSWYAPGYPMPPSAGIPARFDWFKFQEWFQKQYMPVINGRPVGNARGAFGWYTAFVGPNASAQWTHGTYGWGADNDRYIKSVKKSFKAMLLKVRSHGCTRVDNEAISYMRDLLPVGTPLIKIYAREGYRDSRRTGYSEAKVRWDYILTTEDAQSANNRSIDRNAVLARGVPRDQWIEEGSYDIDLYPNAEPIRTSGSAGKANGNLYNIDLSKFRGAFLVDEGTVVGYSHPVDRMIKVGGSKENPMPTFMISNDTNFTMAQ